MPSLLALMLALEANDVVKRAHQLGLVLFYVGLKSNVLEMTPPLTLSDGEVDQALDILDRAFGDVTEGRVSDEVLTEFAGW